jgi:hypothetical protein
MNNRRKRLIWIAPAALAGLALFTWIGGELVMHLWNWLAPALFGWRTVTFWQALGLLVLCRILFGGTGMLRNTSASSRRRMRERMVERWSTMSPEERERYRQSFRGRCGPFEPPPATPGDVPQAPGR